jgi:acid phosphatase family membrane protein YuiD
MTNLLVISICAWAIAQVSKVLVVLVREKRLDLRFLVGSGGMPSAHSALVAALATAVAFTEGVESVAFAIAVVLAMVVTYDAADVRQSVGQQSVVLNRIVQELKLRRPIAEVERDLREFIGHTPFQVVVGAAVGVLVAWLWLFLVARLM